MSDQRDFKTFLFSYDFQGARWSFEIPAQNAAEAQMRLAKMQDAVLDGEAKVAPDKLTDQRDVIEAMCDAEWQADPAQSHAWQWADREEWAKEKDRIRVRAALAAAIAHGYGQQTAAGEFKLSPNGLGIIVPETGVGPIAATEWDALQFCELLNLQAAQIATLTRELDEAREEAAVNVPIRASVDFDDEDGSLVFGFYSEKGTIVASGTLFKSGKTLAHILHGNKTIADERVDLNQEEGWPGNAADLTARLAASEAKVADLEDVWDKNGDEIHAFEEQVNTLKHQLATSERARERLRQALADFVAMGEQYEWDKALTGRDFLMKNARAALADATA